MPGDLEGRTAIVTGAGGGIGRATSLLLAEEGAKVVVSDVDDALGRETARLVAQAGGTADYVHCDVTRSEDVAALVDAAVLRFGDLSILVNNAGWEGPIRPMLDYDEADFERVVAINLNGVFFGAKHAAAAMRRAGKGGSIINLSSVAGLIGFSGCSPYSMAKHGVIGLTKTAALELAPDKIRVNAVCPALIKTRMGADLIEGLGGGPEVEQQLEAAHPMGRGGQPEEVAELILWLASDRSSFSTGGAYTIDGGYTAQ